MRSFFAKKDYKQTKGIPAFAFVISMNLIMPSSVYANSGMEHDMNHGGSATAMSHTKPSMQGGGAPANARDPHEYSGGYQLDSGPYVLDGPRQLVLSDEHTRWSVLFDRLEYTRSDEESDFLTFDAQAAWGWDYDKFIVRSEGEIEEGTLIEQSTELVWSYAVDTFWDSQVGLRFDSGVEKDQSWLTAGVQGLAPYWFEMNVMASVSDEGQMALDLEAEYEVLLTQRLILQPRIEITVLGKDDEAREVGSGFSSMAAGLRLRYEFTRQFAPYIGAEIQETLGDTRALLNDENEATDDVLLVTGVRFWF
ncbi:copper resistance protein B [Litoribacillus peritrichatus]|uniref:Copper resistance protein B n=1 Tax=Litoribacillus peritrichatus TaxID=718191 RepID=A0ABP7MS49_9GAMM